MSKEKEEWRPIKGFEGLYEVSDWGNVRSVDRIIQYKNGQIHKYEGKILTPSEDKNCYYVLALGKNNPNKKVHRLVAETFIPNYEKKTEIDHIDGNPKNNKAENLKWATRKENLNNPVTKERMVKNALKQYTKRERNELGQFK